MKRLRLLASSFILIIAFGAALYTQRVRLSDFARVWSQPAVPESVTYEQVIQEQEAPLPVEPQAEEPAQEPAVEETPPALEPDAEEPAETEPDPQLPAPSPQLPDEFNLAVPFTSQAPFANWDDVHEETCEEASVYMVHLYYEGEPQGLVDPQTAEDELQKIVAFENSIFGFFEDTTSEQTAIFTEQLYGYTDIDIIENPTVEQIKENVSAGFPVIVPSAGQLLGNPYFTSPGPEYHMLVIRGYTKHQFIVNDPGTRRGEAYLYDIDTIMNAMHDWNGGGPITEGRKAIIVIHPE